MTKSIENNCKKCCYYKHNIKECESNLYSFDECILKKIILHNENINTFCKEYKEKNIKDFTKGNNI